MGKGGRYTHCKEDPCGMTWEEFYGTSATGNLPQYKKSKHKGNKWMPCPYSTQAVLDFTNWPVYYGTTIQEYEATFGPVDRYDRIRTMLGLGPNDTLPSLVDHSVTVPVGSGTINKEVFMRPTRRGVWGYECTYSGCPYYLAHGTHYFYA